MRSRGQSRPRGDCRCADEHELIVEQGLDGEILTRRKTADYGKVDLMVLKRDQHLGGRSETEVNVHERALPDELRHDVGNEIGPRCARRAEPQGACFRFDEGSNAAIGLLEQGAGPRDVVGEEASCWGECDRRPAADELDADFAFQRGDVFGHGRLAQVQPLRCTDERALLGEGDERPQTGLQQHE